MIAGMNDPEHREAYAAMMAALAATSPEHKPAIMRAILGWVRLVGQQTVRKAA